MPNIVMVLGAGRLGKEGGALGGILCRSHSVWTSVLYRLMSPQRFSLEALPRLVGGLH